MDRKTVDHVAHLAKLELSESELALYSEQLSKILGYFEQLGQAETSSVAPLLTPTEIEIETRADEIHSSLGAEELLKAAPERAGNLYKVPPVL